MAILSAGANTYMNGATRRTFLMAGSVAAAPFFIKAANKSGTKLPVIGEGEHQYEWIQDWGELPSNIRYGNCHALAEDSQKNIYVLHTVHKDSKSEDSLVVFDAKGKFVRSWGWQFKRGAHGLHLQREDNREYLYISDSQHRVVSKRTLKGEELWTIGYPTDAKPYQIIGGGQGIFYRPTNVTVAANGDFYVADGYGSSYINRYDKDAHYKSTFGGTGAGTGQEPGSLKTPHALIVDTRSETPVLLVTDRANGRLQRFDLEGKVIDSIHGVVLPSFLDERKGIVVVADLASRITILDKDNNVIMHLGDGRYTPEQRAVIRVSEDRGVFEPGKFIAPHSAIFDHAGNIFVAEFVEIGRIVKLRKV
jgi:hypothetical protein